MTKQKRVLALAMAAAILFIVLASAFFIAAEAHHDCIGGGCKICCQINVCCTVLKALALAVIAAVLAVVAGYAFGFGVADKYSDKQGWRFVFCEASLSAMPLPLYFCAHFCKIRRQIRRFFIMKRIFSVFLARTIIASLLCWNVVPAKAEAAKRLSIVTTIFPEYDWVRQILGEKFPDADVTMLLDNGVDLHSYQPTVDDIVKIATCDIFIYVGGESDRC